MIECDPAEPSLLQRCRDVVRTVLAQHGWQLLTHEELARQVVALLETGVIAEPRPAAMYVYSLCLYTACSGAEGLDRQELGFTELYHYLYQLSFREQTTLASDSRQDAINQSLFKIWQKFDRCRKPTAFLAFAAYEMRNALRPLWRRVMPEADFAEMEESPGTHLDDDPVAQALNAELRRQVRGYFEASLHRYPRARQQLEAVWLKYIENLDDVTIGAYLEKPVASVHVLRSRGLERLRAEPGWRSIASELGLLDG
jgi:DNA-directed RNA polymerase specialized sigma24 family protein